MPTRLLRKFLPAPWKARLARSKDDLLARLYVLPGVGRRLWNARRAALESVPAQLNIEVTSICNAACIMCPRHLMDRKMEVMPFDLYAKVVAEAKALGIKRLCLNGYGEIFTAKKDYQHYVTHLLQEIPDARIIINTNASLLDEKAARFLIEHRIDSINVDIDGATKEVFEKIRVNLHFDTVVRNVRRLVELRNAQSSSYPKVRVGMLAQPLNEGQFALFREQWTGIADFVGDDFLVSRGGAVQTHRAADVGRPCYLVWSEMDIWSDGNVALCCDDWNCHELMGDVKKQSLREVWSGPKFAKYRELHARGAAGEIALCAKCSWARPGPAWFQAGMSRK